MREAIQLSMPNELRKLIAVIFVWGSPADPIALWNLCLPHIIEDFCRENPEEVAIAIAYRDIDHNLSSSALSLSRDFGIPLPLAQVPSSIELEDSLK